MAAAPDVRRAARECALPGGGYLGGSYNVGWAMILERFQESTA